MRVLGARLRAGVGLYLSAASAKGIQTGWSPPYALPAVGEVVAIGTNTSNSLYPSERNWTQAQWNYSNFGSYGGGTFSPNYSVAGAFVIAASGGHNHPDNVDVLIFDFEDATWKRLINSNGVLHKDANAGVPAFTVAETSGPPYYEITGSNVPAPSHPYAQRCAVPIGTKGSIVLYGSAAACVESVNSGAIHVFDLNTKTWSRPTNNTAARTLGAESDALYDSGRNRIWGIDRQLHSYQNIGYLDLSTWSTSVTATYPWPDSRLGTGYNRAFMHDGLIIRTGGSNTLWYFDPDNESAGWGQCVLSGTLPATNNRFVRFGSGNYYWRGQTTGNTLTRLQPPANPKTGTWIVDQVTLSGPTMSDFSHNGGMNHYTNLIYVPAINCLAWLPGGNNQVYLARPE